MTDLATWSAAAKKRRFAAIEARLAALEGAV